MSGDHAEADRIERGARRANQRLRRDLPLLYDAGVIDPVTPEETARRWAARAEAGRRSRKQGTRQAERSLARLRAEVEGRFSADEIAVFEARLERLCSVAACMREPHRVADYWRGVLHREGEAETMLREAAGESYADIRRDLLYRRFAPGSRPLAAMVPELENLAARGVLFRADLAEILNRWTEHYGAAAVGGQLQGPQGELFW